MANTLKIAAASAALLASACAFSATYSFEVDQEAGLGKVQIQLESGKSSKSFSMCAWIPGDYQVFNYGSMVVDPEFRKEGKDVSATPAGTNRWTIEEGADEVVYRVKPSRGNFSDNIWLGTGEYFVNGGGVFGWFDGHSNEAHTLLVTPLKPSDEFESPLVWSKTPDGFVAKSKSYDELIDSPFVVSDHLRRATVDVDGKKHMVASFGRNDGVEVEKLAEVGAEAARQALAIFNELPYDKYVFFCHSQGFPAGLEHANSTRVGLWSTKADAALGLLFHEYFHCFNVKRIRPTVLKPFDYTKPAVTGSLWWLEGVTDYYASVMEARSPFGSRDGFLQDLAGTIVGVGRLPIASVSADESSRRVWETRGSSGFGGVSYYAKGKAIGFMLDLAIRTETKGEKSLDDVMLALYNESKKPEGFSEMRIRELCVEIGGDKLGPIYDSAVMSPGPLKIETVAKAAGFIWDGRRLSPDPAATPEAKRVAASVPVR